MSYYLSWNWASEKQRNMTCLIEEYAKFKVRAVIRISQADKVNQSEINRRLQCVYELNTFSLKEAMFGAKNLETCDWIWRIIPRRNEANSRLHSQMNCLKVECFIIKESRIYACEIAEVTGISHSNVHEIICDLNFCNVSEGSSITKGCSN